MDRPLTPTRRSDHGRNARLTPARAGPSPVASDSTAGTSSKIRLRHAPQPAARQIATLRVRYGMLARPRTTPNRASQRPRAPTGPRPRQRPSPTLLKAVALTPLYAAVYSTFRTPSSLTCYRTTTTSPPSTPRNALQTRILQTLPVDTRSWNRPTLNS